MWRSLLVLIHIVGVVFVVGQEAPVYVETVDLSRGLIAKLGPMFFKIPLSGVYHTSVHVFDTEFWFQFDGPSMRRSKIGQRMESSGNITAISESKGKFTEVAEQGRTSKTHKEVMLWFKSAEVQQTFQAEAYDIWKHNCNDFTTRLLSFLGVPPLPRSVMDVPSQILATTKGARLQPTFERVIDLMRKSRKNGKAAGDSSDVDEFLDSLASESEPVAFMVKPIVKMMRKIALRLDRRHRRPAATTRRR
jgi:hypothetical protein